MKQPVVSLINRLCRRLYVCALYESEVGVKCTNQLASSALFNHLVSGEVQVLPTEKLYLWIDGLKDDHTLLDTRLIDSPHKRLVSLLRNGEHVTKSDYVQRAKAGRLDLRPPRRITRSYLGSLSDACSLAIRAVETGEYEPVRVARIGERFYIADGKHRAAVCAVLGVEPRCVDVTTVIYDSFFQWIYRKMLDHEECYRKHIGHFELALRSGGV